MPYREYRQAANACLVRVLPVFEIMDLSLVFGQ